MEYNEITNMTTMLSHLNLHFLRRFVMILGEYTTQLLEVDIRKKQTVTDATFLFIFTNSWSL